MCENGLTGPEKDRLIDRRIEAKGAEASLSDMWITLDVIADSNDLPTHAVSEIRELQDQVVAAQETMDRIAAESKVIDDD